MTDTLQTNASGVTLQPFVAEAMVSAGPRKSAEDYKSSPVNAELCEDCAGICWVGDHLLFWLSDGASNSMALSPVSPEVSADKGSAPFGFSTRILAKDLGSAFVEEVCKTLRPEEKLARMELPDLAATAFAQVATVWDERWRAYIAGLTEAGTVNHFIASLPQAPDHHRVEWQATFTGGIFAPKEKVLVLINYGSSAGLVMRTPAVIIPPNDNAVVLLATLKLGEPIQSVVMPLVDEQQWQQFPDVDAFAIVCDGMDRHNVRARLERIQNQSFQTLTELRAELLAGAEPTGDDKSIVFGRFLGG